MKNLIEIVENKFLVKKNISKDNSDIIDYEDLFKRKRIKFNKVDIETTENEVRQITNELKDDNTMKHMFSIISDYILSINKDKQLITYINVYMGNGPAFTVRTNRSNHPVGWFYYYNDRIKDKRMQFTSWNDEIDTQNKKEIVEFITNYYDL